MPEISARGRFSRISRHEKLKKLIVEILENFMGTKSSKNSSQFRLCTTAFLQYKQKRLQINPSCDHAHDETVEQCRIGVNFAEILMLIARQEILRAES